MENPNPPGIAALGAMTDTLDFVKKMWGNLGVPGMVVPTLSIDEINKKISDLKAVESWLALNMNMLRGTIQALEVQSGTIAALQSMSVAIGIPGTPQGESAPPFESPFAARRRVRRSKLRRLSSRPSKSRPGAGRRQSPELPRPSRACRISLPHRPIRRPGGTCCRSNSSKRCCMRSASRRPVARRPRPSRKRSRPQEPSRPPRASASRPEYRRGAGPGWRRERAV